MAKRALIDRRRSVSERIVFAVSFVIFLLYSLSIIYLFYWAITSSLKTNREFFAHPFAFPENLLFSNYADAFVALHYKDTNFIGMIFNSLWLTIGKLFLSLMMVSLTGYVFAKYKFIGRGLLYSIVIFSLVVPILGSGAASYKLIYDLGLNDSPLYLITALGGFGMNFIIFEGVYRGIPKDYMEASFIDGGGHFYTYFRIMLPMVIPVMTAMAITGFIAGWNDYMTSLMYLDKFPTLAAGLYFYQQELQYASNEPLYFAGVLMCATPVLIMFAVFQDKVMNKVSVGGLKG